MYVWRDMKIKVSVIIPAYNEEACIQELDSKLKAIIKIEINIIGKL
jgi:glycosyltransferase involved in cell wall biosynthesis